MIDTFFVVRNDFTGEIGLCFLLEGEGDKKLIQEGKRLTSHQGIVGHDGDLCRSMDNWTVIKIFDKDATKILSAVLLFDEAATGDNMCGLILHRLNELVKQCVETGKSLSKKSKMKPSKASV